MIDFNRPPYVGTELDFVTEAVCANHKISGDGPFTVRCNQWIEDRAGTPCALLTTSGSTALDMAAILCNLEPGDEVIVPSYTFPTTASAFVAQGAVPVFVDVRPDTMNIDEALIEPAITDRTRAIAAMHYGGIACEMQTISAIASEYGLKVVEDAAQAVTSTYHGRALGSIGDFGCYSFHETKNFSMGEGGALLVNDEASIERAEIIREKGTNRARFFRGQVDKYTWVDCGSSYLPSELNAAYLWAQLQAADQITAERMATWEGYQAAFASLASAERIEVPVVPEGCTFNAHLYFLKCRDLADRTAFIEHMAAQGVQCSFHYVPLHSSPAGMQFGRFYGTDCYTTTESERLVRLPLFYGMTSEERATVIEAALAYFESAR